MQVTVTVKMAAAAAAADHGRPQIHAKDHAKGRHHLWQEQNLAEKAAQGTPKTQTYFSGADP